MVNFIQPVNGRISSAFGVDRGTHTHGGIDIAAGCGTPVRAAASGRVSVAKWSDSAGNMIILDHGNGIDTRYFHLSRFAVSADVTVQQGDVIGYVGDTGNSRGCHLHWEVRINNQAIDPQNALRSGLSVGGNLPSDSYFNYSPQPNIPPGNNNAMLYGVIFLIFIAILRR